MDESDIHIATVLQAACVAARRGEAGHSDPDLAVLASAAAKYLDASYANDEPRLPPLPGPRGGPRRQERIRWLVEECEKARDYLEGCRGKPEWGPSAWDSWFGDASSADRARARARVKKHLTSYDPAALNEDRPGIVASYLLNFANELGFGVPPIDRSALAEQSTLAEQKALAEQIFFARLSALAKRLREKCGPDTETCELAQWVLEAVGVDAKQADNWTRKKV